MNTYRITLKYSRLWEESITAESIDAAHIKARQIADFQDESCDINEREWISLAAVKSSGSEEYEYTECYGDSITCDDCSSIVGEWWTGEGRAICSICKVKA